MAAELVGLEFLKKNEIKDKSCDAQRPYAFISYSHDSRDAQIVMNVFNLLYNKGYNLWIDIANMPHDENAWSDCAIAALRNKRCAFAFFFRSESSMAKETIAKELETIKRLRHVDRIVTVDIWHDEKNTADLYYDELLNDDHPDSDIKFKACERICNIVSMANSAIRLAADVQNDILMLAEFMEEELQSLGVLPAKGGDKPDLVPVPEPEPEPEPEPNPTPTPTGGGNVLQTITLPDFVKRYNLKTFVKSTFREFRLVGRGEYAKYDSAFYPSASLLVCDFVERQLKERGEAYIQFVNERNAGSKNPPFITAEEQQRRKAEGNTVSYRLLNEPGLKNWAMCIHYGQYAWINDVLRKRMLELGLPLEEFSLEYIPGQETETGEDTETPTGGVKGPVDPTGKRKRTLAEDGYSITLNGEYQASLSLKKMMLAVFKNILNRHPDKVDLLLEKLPCLGEGIEIGRDAHPSTFRAGETMVINGRNISIGTSLGQAQVLSYMKRLVHLCGELGEYLIIHGYED